MDRETLCSYTDENDHDLEAWRPRVIISTCTPKPVSNQYKTLDIIFLSPQCSISLDPCCVSLISVHNPVTTCSHSPDQLTVKPRGAVDRLRWHHGGWRLTPLLPWWFTASHATILSAPAIFTASAEAIFGAGSHVCLCVSRKCRLTPVPVPYDMGSFPPAVKPWKQHHTHIINSRLPTPTPQRQGTVP